MGAALGSPVGEVVSVPITIRWQQQTPLKTLLFMLSICFQNQSSSTNIAIDAFPLWRTILLLSMLSQFTYFSPPQETNTCVNCALIPTYLLIALIILLCINNYPWDIHVTSWKQPLKLNLLLCCFNAFTLNYCFMS